MGLPSSAIVGTGALERRTLGALLERSARSGLALQRDDGSMPAGHNGPWNDPETPLRNTGLWLQQFLVAFGRSGDLEFRRAAEGCAAYMGQPSHRPGAHVFLHRPAAPGREANGLIGQAWTALALVTAAEGLSREELLTLAVDVLERHPFDEELGLWDSLALNGETSSLNLTVNQQVWFAVAAASAAFHGRPILRSRVDRFLSRMLQIIDYRRSGLLSHLISPFRLARRFPDGWITYLSKSVAGRRSQGHLSAGYHAFTLLGLAELRRRTAAHPIWALAPVEKWIEYCRTDDYRSRLLRNPFGFGYNPVGFEVASSLLEFEPKSAAEAQAWAQEQLERCYDSATGRLGRNASDPQTLEARMVEASDLQDVEVRVLWEPKVSGSRAPQATDHASPFVSVIVPVYNDRHALAGCLEALACQTYPRHRYEVIVVDNGSDEAEVPRPDRRRDVRHIRAPIPGSYRARNAGVHAADGEILAFTDADCRPAQDWIAAGVHRLVQVDRPGIVAGAVQIVPDDPVAPNLAERYELATSFPQEHNVRRARFGVTANLMTWREVFVSVGPFRDDLRSGGDLDWGRRVADAGRPVVFAPGVRVTHRARRTLRELIAKSRRLAAGKLDIDRGRGALLTGTLKEFFPSPVVVRRILTSPDGGGLWTRSRLLGLHLLLRQARFWERLRRISGAEAPR